MTLFTNGPDGMTGNDDLGTMSAWYVFSSLGLYPTMSGGDFLAVSSPQFESATVRIGSYPKASRHQGPGRHADDRSTRSERHEAYVQSVALNGRDVPQTWLSWNKLAHGGTLATGSGPPPPPGARGKGAQPPSVNQASPDSRKHVDASLRPASAVVPTGDAAQTAKFTLDVLGQAPGKLNVSVTAKVAQRLEGHDGTAFTTGDRFRSPPVQKKVRSTSPWPPGVAAGSYPVEVKVAGRGTNSSPARPPHGGSRHDLRE
ncbi:hypothetical protein GCM10023238_32110 [Streptomyces heliomycini]